MPLCEIGVSNRENIDRISPCLSQIYKTINDLELEVGTGISKNLPDGLRLGLIENPRRSNLTEMRITFSNELASDLGFQIFEKIKQYGVDDLYLDSWAGSDFRKSTVETRKKVGSFDGKRFQFTEAGVIVDWVSDESIGFDKGKGEFVADEILDIFNAFFRRNSLRVDGIEKKFVKQIEGENLGLNITILNLYERRVFLEKEKVEVIFDRVEDILQTSGIENEVGIWLRPNWKTEYHYS